MELFERDEMAGANTEKVAVLEAAPPGLVTCTVHWPGELSRLAGTVAVSVPLLTNTLANATPLRETMDWAFCAGEPTKFAPVTVSARALEPAGTEGGEMAGVMGATAVTVNGSALDVALPGCATVTAALPTAASNALGTTAASWYELTKVVASGVTT